MPVTLISIPPTGAITACASRDEWRARHQHAADSGMNRAAPSPTRTGALEVIGRALSDS